MEPRGSKRGWGADKACNPLTRDVRVCGHFRGDIPYPPVGARVRNTGGGPVQHCGNSEAGQVTSINIELARARSRLHPVTAVDRQNPSTSVTCTYIQKVQHKSPGHLACKALPLFQSDSERLRPCPGALPAAFWRGRNARHRAWPCLHPSRFRIKLPPNGLRRAVRASRARSDLGDPRRD